LASKKLYCITSPTVNTLNYLKSLKIFDEKKLFLLKDPVIKIREIAFLKKEQIDINLDTNVKYLISIGRLTHQKNFSLLISSFYEIKKIFKEYKLIILGDGEQKKKLQLLINNLKLDSDVFLLGYQKNIFKYLSISECLICTSLWEDPGFIIIEAGILNKIIISSNCLSGPKELLDSNNGYLFNNNSKSSLVQEFINYKNTSLIDNKNKIYISKKKFKDYSIYNHFLNIRSLL
jgi:glycosyltransferase involved in cell wall biosynthesis